MKNKTLTTINPVLLSELLPSALADGLAKLLQKLALATFLIVALLMHTSSHIFGEEKGEKDFPEVIYPRYRVWTTPSAGEEPEFNSPSFEWPSKKRAKYSVRLSSSKDFSTDLIEKDEIPFAIFNPHKILDEGKWFWQYKTEGGKWNEIDSFLITSSTPKFATPEIKKVLQEIPAEHPRVLVRKADLDEFRTRAKEYRESAIIIREADKYLNQPPPSEESVLPVYKGRNDFENEKIALLASKKTGWHFHEVLNLLSQAYVLTGDKKYFETAKKWMLEVSKWDPNGPSHTSDFGDSGIMTGLAVGVDTFWDLLTKTERDRIIKPAAVRANQFYILWISQVESRSSSMHVWQHILHRMLYASLAFSGEIPEAGLWLEYIYELWIAQSPKMGEKDGAWINGTGYFRMNTLTMYDVSAVFKDLTGVDFLWSEFYRNNPRWLIYAFPPKSVADGFCNDGNKHPEPTVNYAGFADAAARIFQDSYALWYSNEVTKSLGLQISDDDEFRWYRIQRGYKMKLPQPVREFNLPQAAKFPDVGVVYMNTSLQNPETNLMLSLRSSPFGSLAHTHADQNTFNIAYGGEKLFYNTGYRPAMGDPHFLGWYKHTQGHNGILIDGQGQPFSDGAYGWIPRFLHGEQISYAVGDASNAYSGEFDKIKTELGMKHFRRHYIMLRPSVIVIYDELEAGHKAQWSWLLHNDNGFVIDSENKTIVAESEKAKAKVSLFSSTPIEFTITDKFSVPVDNWTNKVDEEGEPIVFKNQWHFSGISSEKTEKMRYLAVFQVKPDGSFEPVVSSENGNLKVGNWNIKAQLNTSEPANIQVWNNENTASLVSDGMLNFSGKAFNWKENNSSKLAEVKNGKVIFQEAKDEIPEVIQRVKFRER
ncbi:MAG: DUF4962 domain-containing protein [Bacteroidetes bacterium]|nr:MAG: DUF4962 domain-containing protein [Bacteroidota bacterium]